MDFVLAGLATASMQKDSAKRPGKKPTGAHGGNSQEPDFVLASRRELGHSVAMSVMRNAWSQDEASAKPGAEKSPSRSVRLSRLRKLCACEQVAAVCYRIASGKIEFLLVRTRSGRRWTFPKGSAEPGLSHAQAAALEAFEEAGVHGRIEEAAFARYRRLTRNDNDSSGSRSPADGTINAHLCEVLRLSAPKESGRGRTWFSINDVRQRLCEGRTQKQAAEFVRVIDKAVARIKQSADLHAGKCQSADKSVPLAQSRFQPDTQSGNARRDALQQVKFDFSEVCGWMQSASFKNDHSRMNAVQDRSSSRTPRRENLPCEILEFETPGRLKLPN